MQRYKGRPLTQYGGDPAGGWWRFGEAGSTRDDLLEPPHRYPSNVSGAGENVAANNATAAHQASTRDRGRGRSVSSTGGCPRRPRDRRSTSPPQMYQPNHRLPSAMTTNQKARATRWCHCGSRAYRICPPSSWPMGSRLSIVTNIPTQPETAGGRTI